MISQAGAFSISAQPNVPISSMTNIMTMRIEAGDDNDQGMQMAGNSNESNFSGEWAAKKRRRRKKRKKNNPRSPTCHPLLCLNDSHHLCSHTENTSAFLHLLRPKIREKKRKKHCLGSTQCHLHLYSKTASVTHEVNRAELLTKQPVGGR